MASKGRGWERGDADDAIDSSAVLQSVGQPVSQYVIGSGTPHVSAAARHLDERLHSEGPQFFLNPMRSRFFSMMMSLTESNTLLTLAVSVAHVK